MIRIRILLISHHIEWVRSHDSCEREEEREGLEVDVEAAQRVADRAARVLRLPKQNLKKTKLKYCYLEILHFFLFSVCLQEIDPFLDNYYKWL